MKFFFRRFSVGSVQLATYGIFETKQFPTPLKLIGDGLTKVGSFSLFNPFHQTTHKTSTTANRRITPPTKNPLLNRQKSPSLQPVLKNAIEANTKLLLSPLKMVNSKPALPKLVTRSSDRIINVFKQITTAPTLIDTASRLFGAHVLEQLKTHSKAVIPLWQILVLLLKALQTYVENTDPKEVSKVLGKLINVFNELIHQQQ